MGWSKTLKENCTNKANNINEVHIALVFSERLERSVRFTMTEHLSFCHVVAIGVRQGLFVHLQPNIKQNKKKSFHVLTMLTLDVSIP